MKIVLVNAKFGADLEDGVAAECLEYGLRQRLPEIDIVNCDLAGRQNFGRNTDGLRSLAGRLPTVTPALKNNSVYIHILAALVRARLLPHYDKTINGADIALFGGGQILADINLDNPMKVAAAASIVRNRNVPIAIHAVGVGANWSEAGAALYKEAFAGADIIWASVRDALSDRRWRRHFDANDLPPPRISLDPAMLAVKTYGETNTGPAPRRNRPMIGLNVTRPSALIAQADIGGAEQIAPDAEFYRRCAEAILAKDCDVLLFTNGAPGDESYLRRCFPQPYLARFSDQQIQVAPQSRTPKDLVALIRNCDGVVSHRLNVCIIAYSCRVPHVGLSLNAELDSFFEVIDRRDFVLGPDNVQPDDIASAIARAGEASIDNNAHAAIVARVESEFDALATQLSKVDPGQKYRAASA